MCRPYPASACRDAAHYVRGSCQHASADASLPAAKKDGMPQHVLKIWLFCSRRGTRRRRGGGGVVGRELMAPLIDCRAAEGPEAGAGCSARRKGHRWRTEQTLEDVRHPTLVALHAALPHVAFLPSSPCSSTRVHAALTTLTERPSSSSSAYLCPLVCCFGASVVVRTPGCLCKQGT